MPAFNQKLERNVLLQTVEVGDCTVTGLRKNYKQKLETNSRGILYNEA
jgi:hypothetical protein